LISWIETNKLVQLESEGRDADMDRIMESREETSEDDKKAESKLESEKATQSTK
jgi:hypothetical protein